MNQHFSVRLDDTKGVSVVEYYTYKPSENTKSIKVGRGDYVLLTDAGGDLLPWAKLTGLAVYEERTSVGLISYNLARVEVMEAATEGECIDPQVYAPRIRTTERTVFIPATCIQQRVVVCSDTSESSDGALWVNWFVTWGALRYPIEHRDQIHREHGLPIEYEIDNV